VLPVLVCVYFTILDASTPMCNRSCPSVPTFHSTDVEARALLARFLARAFFPSHFLTSFPKPSRHLMAGQKASATGILIFFLKKSEKKSFGPKDF
jgi:hypothetical protein